jgi:hypothetical protein
VPQLRRPPKDAGRYIPSNVEILTRRGWLTYDQLREDDETVGYYFATGRSEWTPMTAVHVHADAPLVRLTNKTWEAVCSPNHRWVARKHVQVRRDNSDGGPQTSSVVVEEWV